MSATITTPTTFSILLATTLSEMMSGRNIPTSVTIILYKLSSYIVRAIYSLVMMNNKSRTSTTIFYKISSGIGSKTRTLRSPNNTP